MNEMDLKKQTLQELMGMMDDHMFKGMRKRGEPIEAEMSVEVEPDPMLGAESPAELTEEKLDPDTMRQLMEMYAGEGGDEDEDEVDLGGEI